jgi:hypothetical protein
LKLRWKLLVPVSFVRIAIALLLAGLVGFLVPVSFVRVHAGSNRSPQAEFSYAPSEGTVLTVNTVVAFDGSGSGDPDGRIVSYEWDFDGDGIYDLASDGPTVEWLYDEAGDYQASLRVTDNDGAVAMVTKEIDVEDAPIVVRQTISTTMPPTQRAGTGNRALPGDWIEVTVEISFHETVNGPGLKPELPEGWRLREVDSDGFTFKSSELVWVLIGQGLLGDRLEITYKVRVPEDAARGSYRIGGFVSSFSPRFKIPIPEDVEMQVI